MRKQGGNNELCLFWFSQLLHLHVEKAKFHSLYLQFQFFFPLLFFTPSFFLKAEFLNEHFYLSFDLFMLYDLRLCFLLFFFGGGGYKKGVWKFIFVNNSLLYVYFTPFSAFGFNFLWLFSVTPLLWAELITECHWKNIKIHGCYPC